MLFKYIGMMPHEFSSIDQSEVSEYLPLHRERREAYIEVKERVRSDSLIIVDSSDNWGRAGYLEPIAILPHPSFSPGSLIRAKYSDAESPRFSPRML